MTAEKVLLCIVSFFVPIVGVVLWIVKKDEGKIYGIVGIISWVLGIISSVVMSFVFPILMALLESGL
jgi:hypothetical protein